MPQQSIELDSSQQWKLLIVRVLAAIAILISSYPAYVTFSNSGPAGCGDGASSLGCDEVLATRWSSWFGIPVSVFAVLTYLLVFFCSFRVKTNNVAKTVFQIVGFTAGLAALWFVFLQVFVLEKFCPYCMAVHACGLTIAGLIGACGSFSQQQPKKAGIAWAGKPIAMAALGMLVLIGGQYAYAPPEILVSDLSDQGQWEQGREQEREQTNEGTEQTVESTSNADSPSMDSGDATLTEPDAIPTASAKADADATQVDQAAAKKPSNNASDAAIESEPAADIENRDPDKPAVKTPDRFERVGPVTVNVAQSILIGDPDTEEIVVEMVDYTCPKCRQAHRQLENFKKVSSEPFATLLLLVPLNSSCNPYIRSTHPMNAQACQYAKLAFVLWELQPEAFSGFHSWMMQGDTPPDITAAMNYVAKLLPEANLNELMNRQDLPGKISVNTDIYFRTGTGKLPRFYINEHSIAGVPSDERQMFSTFQNLLAKQ